MGGIGIKIKSKPKRDDAPPTPITSLPPKIVDEIINALGVTKADEVRQSLTTGKWDIPDDVEITIERVSTNTSMTITKSQSGAEFKIDHQGNTKNIKP